MANLRRIYNACLHRCVDGSPCCKLAVNDTYTYGYISANYARAVAGT